ncbi:MAG: sugar nucleotide-binding protein, partial [Turicibacter sp.]
ENPALAHDVNTLATSYLAKGCAMKKAKLIFTSTDQVYNGNSETGPYAEDVPLNPMPVYAQTKLNAENLIKQDLEEFYNLRLTWLFALPEVGKRVNPNLIMNVIHAIKQQQQLSLAGDDLRGITYAYDVIENIEPLLDIPFGDYNFGSENNHSTYDIGVNILSLIAPMLHPDDVLIKEFNRFNGKPRDLRISTEKLKRNGIYIGSTREGIEKCIFEGKAKDFKTFQKVNVRF